MPAPPSTSTPRALPGAPRAAPPVSAPAELGAAAAELGAAAVSFTLGSLLMQATSASEQPRALAHHFTSFTLPTPCTSPTRKVWSTLIFFRPEAVKSIAAICQMARRAPGRLRFTASRTCVTSEVAQRPAAAREIARGVASGVTHSRTSPLRPALGHSLAENAPRPCKSARNPGFARLYHSHLETLPEMV